ncbi:MAG: DUF6519 domain-containing protein [Almyronema sp.]
MKGDFSRYTFNREKHYSAVLMQQGRVQVDADWNEQQAIARTRIETEAVDVIGRCGAPKHNAGFEIQPAGSEFEISAGRFYVEGILCENETAVLYSQQPDLPNPVALDTLFTNTQTGLVYLDVWQRHLTALDDPQLQEVALGDPDTTTRLKTVWQVKVLPLTESANTATCDAELSEWQALIAPSSGTLMAQTAEPDASENPCLIPPNAGYLRLENQLYRVEVHQGSETGGVTFKWSRDNGSIVTAIKRIDGAEITVANLGRDQALGFAKGQWVEISDDALALSGQPGELLQIEDFVLSADSDPIIVLATAPTPLASGAGFPDGIDRDRHPQLRRWDQKGVSATATGVAVAAGWLNLEAGIQVQFSGGTYKTGDYWLIPARTATGQIEWPMTAEPTPAPLAQPPLGIAHHYCRLAIAQFVPSNTPAAAASFSLLQVCDHRFCPLTELEPGAACCTVVVQPGENIQAAIDALPPAGGCVCLKTGVHPIRQPIRLAKSNVVLKGESPGTRVVRRNGLSLLSIYHPKNQLLSHIKVEQISFEAVGLEAEVSNLLDLSLLVVGICQHVRVQHCRFEVAAAADNRANSTLPIAAAIGIVVVNSNQVTLLENTVRLTMIGIWAEGSTACDFSGNKLIGPILPITDLLAISAGYSGILLNLLPTENQQVGNDCRLSQNHIQDFLIGIVAGGRSDRCLICHNQIHRQAINQLPLADFNNQFLVGNEPYIYGIVTFGTHIAIADNFLELNSPSYGGIRAFGSFTRIEHNTLQSTLTKDLLANSSQLPIAIFLGQITANDEQLPEPDLNYSVVENNQLIGTLTGIGIANAEGVEVIANQIGIFESVASLSVGVALANSRSTFVSANQIRGADIGIFLVSTPPQAGLYNRLSENHLSDGSYGIGAVSETALAVSGNLIENMKLAGFAAINLIESARLSHNRIANCGYQPPAANLSNLAASAPIGAGIFILSILGHLTIESCQVANTGISRQGEIAAENTLLGIAVGWVLACEITHNQVFYSEVNSLAKISLAPLHRSLVVAGWFQPVTLDIRYPQLGNALITHNLFQGLGFPHLVELRQYPNAPQLGFEQVNFSHNQCFHLRTQPDQPVVFAGMVNIPRENATVSTWGRQLVVMANQVKADNPSFASMDLSNPERVTLMGNLTSGSIFNFGGGVTPANPGDFNVYS